MNTVAGKKCIDDVNNLKEQLVKIKDTHTNSFNKKGLSAEQLVEMNEAHSNQLEDLINNIQELKDNMSQNIQPLSLQKSQGAVHNMQQFIEWVENAGGNPIDEIYFYYQWMARQDPLSLKLSREIRAFIMTGHNKYVEITKT